MNNQTPISEITTGHLEFLDDLRDSGSTNMYGARPYIMKEFGVDKEAASQILSHWMKTYSQRHPQ